MALVSPGVSVSIIDEAPATSAGPGTIPLIIAPTRSNKTDQAGEGTAPGTLDENAGALTLITSQRELLQNYGVPQFMEAGGSQLHGHELSEYGLLAAHSFLSVSNRIFVLRPDIDLGQLEARVNPPEEDPEDGTYWLDLNNTRFGIFEWNDSTTEWDPVDPVVIEDDSNLTTAGEPKLSVNAGIGDYAVVPGVTDAGENRVYYRTSSAWELVETGFDGGKDVQFASHVNVPEEQSDGSTPLVAGDVYIQTTEPNQGALYELKLFDSVSGRFDDVNAPLYQTRNDAIDALSVDGEVEAGTVFVHYNPSDSTSTISAEHAIMVHNGQDETVAASDESPTTTEITIDINGTPVTLTDGSDPDAIAGDINNEGIADISAEVVDLNRILIINEAGKDLELGGQAVIDLGFSTAEPVIFSNWENLDYVAQSDEPSESSAAGRYWFKSGFDVDFMEHDGTDWVDFAGEVFVQATEPDSPAEDDLWIDTTAMDEYPLIRRYDGSDFVLVDKTDDTTKNGIVFADVRPEPGDPLDLDAPNPAVYPKGILLFNMRYASQNVKQWTEDYTFEGQLVGDRWVTVSGINDDGTPVMGRFAPKEVIIRNVTEEIINNEDLRSVNANFNLLAAPGFPEVTQQLTELNVERKETGFIVADAPFRLSSKAQDLRDWVTNESNATRDGEEGLVTRNDYVAFYYPNGFTSNVDGTQVVVPPSHMALRTIAVSDQISYPWFAPAGFQRGRVENATAVGFVNEDGEFRQVQLNEGQSDVLYENNVNPIEDIPQRGRILMGQKTRSPEARSLDRINVARLTNFIRREADRLAETYLFEPNDTITRKGIKNAFERFFGELVTQRGVDDFVIVSDTTNNTPARIDRNELWVDIAFIPIQAAEFVFVPIRIRGTGDDLEIN